MSTAPALARPAVTVAHAPRARRRAVVLALVLLVTLSMLLSAGVGAVHLTPADIFGALARRLGLAAAGEQVAADAIFFAIRLPRLLLACVVGAGLAMSGAAMQGVFRNPLADPALIGVSSGASVAAAVVIVLGLGTRVLGGFAIPVAAFLGGLGATAVVWRLAGGHVRTRTNGLLLAGIAVVAICEASIGILILVADDVQLRTLAFWRMGGIGGATWSSLATACPLVGIGLFLLPRDTRAMNALLLGDAEAAHLGIAVERLRRRVVLLVCLTIGGAVAATGVIGFIGLVVPHVARLLVGPDHRGLFPASALLGAVLLTLADAAARTVAAPAEIPVGALTALIGAPFFLFLLSRPQAHEGRP